MKQLTLLTLAEIEEAQTRIAAYVRRTPLVRNETLSRMLNTNIYLKLEIFQKTGAFKARGAFNKMLTLTEEERRRGVVAVSGGNHAQAVAYAASTLGVKSLILMPENTPSNYVEATRGYGAEVVFAPSISGAFNEARHYQEQGKIYIHPFDDRLVMAGQGTIGLELLADCPNLTDVIVSIAGGGLISGVATAVKTKKPEARVWGVETIGADSMSRALAAGRVITLPSITSIARTLGAPAVSEEALAIVQRYVEAVKVISDADAVAALELLLERTKLLTEPAASCTLAAAKLLQSNFTPDSHVVLLLCGGNVSLGDICEFKQRFKNENTINIGRRART